MNVFKSTLIKTLIGLMFLQSGAIASEIQTQQSSNQKKALEIIVNDSETKYMIPGVTTNIINSKNYYTIVSDEHGLIRTRNTEFDEGDEIKINLSRLGYLPKDTTIIFQHQPIVISMTPTSVPTNDVIVTAGSPYASSEPIRLSGNSYKMNQTAVLNSPSAIADITRSTEQMPGVYLANDICAIPTVNGHSATIYYQGVERIANTRYLQSMGSNNPMDIDSVNVETNPGIDKQSPLGYINITSSVGVKSDSSKMESSILAGVIESCFGVSTNLMKFSFMQSYGDVMRLINPDIKIPSSKQQGLVVEKKFSNVLKVGATGVYTSGGINLEQENKGTFTNPIDNTSEEKFLATNVLVTPSSSLFGAQYFSRINIGVQSVTNGVSLDDSPLSIKTKNDMYSIEELTTFFFDNKSEMKIGFYLAKNQNIIDGNFTGLDDVGSDDIFYAQQDTVRVIDNYSSWRFFSEYRFAALEDIFGIIPTIGTRITGNTFNNESSFEPQIGFFIGNSKTGGNLTLSRFTKLETNMYPLVRRDIIIKPTPLVNISKLALDFSTHLTYDCVMGSALTLFWEENRLGKQKTKNSIFLGEPADFNLVANGNSNSEYLTFFIRKNPRKSNPFFGGIDLTFGREIEKLNQTEKIFDHESFFNDWTRNIDEYIISRDVTTESPSSNDLGGLLKADLGIQFSDRITLDILYKTISGTRYTPITFIPIMMNDEQLCNEKGEGLYFVEYGNPNSKRFKRYENLTAQLNFRVTDRIKIRLSAYNLLNMITGRENITGYGFNKQDLEELTPQMQELLIQENAEFLSRNMSNGHTFFNKGSPGFITISVSYSR